MFSINVVDITLAAAGFFFGLALWPRFAIPFAFTLSRWFAKPGASISSARRTSINSIYVTAAFWCTILATAIWVVARRSLRPPDWLWFLAGVALAPLPIVPYAVRILRKTYPNADESVRARRRDDHSGAGRN